MMIGTSWKHLVVAAGLGVAFVACSADDTSGGAADDAVDGTADASTTGHGDASVSNDAGKADGSTDSGSTDGGATDAADDADAIPTNCTEITLAQFKWNTSGYTAGASSIVTGLVSPNFGDSALEDSFNIEFYGSAFDPSLNGENVGTFDLSAGGDANYQTCSRCILVDQDNDPTNGAAKVFFQRAGTLTLASDADPVNGIVKGSVSNVTLVEVTVDPTTYLSTPVDGGACLHIKSSTFDVTKPVVPAAWTCNTDYYGDGVCDCGCGALDMDCADGTGGSCSYCNATGTCATDDGSQTGCPSNIDQTQNWLCTAPPP